MKFAICLILLLTSILHAEESTIDPITGKWLFQGNIPVTINADGTASANNGLTATWIYLKNPEIERSYRFVWNGGLYIDKLELSRDFSTLRGRHENKKGDNKVSANRVIDSIQ